MLQRRWHNDVALIKLIGLGHARTRLLVERFLMRVLNSCIRVLIEFTAHLFKCFWIAETLVHHALVVAYEAHFTLELRVEVVLAVRESVSLLLHSGTVTLLAVTEPIVLHVVLPQAVVEGALSVSGMVHQPKATRIVRNVGVAATSIVNVDNRL